MQTTRQFSYTQRVAILLVLLLVGLGAVLALDPIPQDPDYHLFADNRGLFGIPNFADVLSSTGFAIVGALGIAAVTGTSQRLIFSSQDFARPYIVFFVGVSLVSLGSAYYHWDPGNERLLWDRLPMSVAFMAFMSAVIADRVHANTGNGWLLPVLIVLGVSSLLYWHHTEHLQRGDLRFYAFVQFSPIAILPFILWLFPKYKYVPGRYIAWVVAWYGLSKVLEHFDAEVFALLDYTVSGHTLKHLAAAASAFAILRMLTARLDYHSQEIDLPANPG